jgi:hypothetical protein
MLMRWPRMLLAISCQRFLMYNRHGFSYTLESHICDHSRNCVVAICDTGAADGVGCCDGWYQSRRSTKGGLQESCEIGLPDGKDPAIFSEAPIGRFSGLTVLLASWSLSIPGCARCYRSICAPPGL